MRTLPARACLALCILLPLAIPAQGRVWKEPRLEQDLALTFERRGSFQGRVTPGLGLEKVLDWRHDAPGAQALPGIATGESTVHFVSIAHRGSPRRTDGRDLLVGEALLGNPEDAAERSSSLVLQGRFFGQKALHAWIYEERAGAGLGDGDDAIPISVFSELVDTAVGHRQESGEDTGPDHEARWVRVMILWPKRAELHLMGSVRHVLAGGAAPPEGVVPRNRVLRREIHLRFRYADGAVSLETVRDGAGEAKAWPTAGLPAWSHGASVMKERVVDAGRREAFVAAPRPLAFDHALFATGKGITRPALVATCADWEQWMKRARGRRPAVAGKVAKAGPVPMRVGSWLFAEGRGRKEKLVFRCPLGIEVDLLADGVFNGLPATRRLVTELVTEVFPAEPVRERFPIPLLEESTR